MSPDSSRVSQTVETWPTVKLSGRAKIGEGTMGPLPWTAEGTLVPPEPAWAALCATADIPPRLADGRAIGPADARSRILPLTSRSPSDILGLTASPALLILHFFLVISLDFSELLGLCALRLSVCIYIFSRFSRRRLNGFKSFHHSGFIHPTDCFLLPRHFKYVLQLSFSLFSLFILVPALRR